MSAPIHVVTVFVTYRNKVLVLKRSQHVGTYQGQWAAVSGYMESKSPELQARRELSEELGLESSHVVLRVTGNPLEVTDPLAKRIWVVHPFRFESLHPEQIRLDWEHREMRWISPECIDDLDTVPGLWDAWCSVAEDA